MGVNPIPVAVICIIAYSVQALILGAGVVDVDLDFDGCSDIGGLDILFDLAECGVDGGAFVFQFLAFDLVSMPWFIGIPIAVACVGTIVWSVVQLIRGV